MAPIKSTMPLPAAARLPEKHAPPLPASITGRPAAAFAALAARAAEGGRMGLPTAVPVGGAPKERVMLGLGRYLKMKRAAPGRRMEEASTSTPRVPLKPVPCLHRLALTLTLEPPKMPSAAAAMKRHFEAPEEVA